MQRYKKHFDHVVRYDILFKHHFTNVMQLPKINEIVLNIGIGRSLGGGVVPTPGSNPSVATSKKGVVDRKQIISALLAMELISGQKPIITRAKKSIDKFKLREKTPIGCKVTLRNKNMYEFLDRLVHLVFPNVEDLIEPTHGSVGWNKNKNKNRARPNPQKRPPTSLGRRICKHSSRPLSLQTTRRRKKTPNNPFSPNENSHNLHEAKHAVSVGTTFGIKDFFTFREIQYDQFDAGKTGASCPNGVDISMIFGPWCIHPLSKNWNDPNGSMGQPWNKKSQNFLTSFQIPQNSL